MNKDLDITDPSWANRTMRPDLEEALRQIPSPGYGEHVAIEFSVLDAAAHRYLRPKLPGHVRVQRHMDTPGSVVYKIHSDQLGPLGEVTLRKLDDHITEFWVTTPPRPQLPPETREEMKYMFRPQDDPGTKEQDEAFREAREQRKKEQEAHHRWRRAHQAALIVNFKNRLSQEQEWVAQAKDTTRKDDDTLPESAITEERSRGRPRQDIYDEGYRIYYRNNHDARVAFDVIKQRYPEHESLDYERFRQAMLYRAKNRGRRKRRKL